jgi:hypothetical protein
VVLQAQSAWFEDSLHLLRRRYGPNRGAAWIPAGSRVNLMQCFDEVDSHIRQHLELVAPVGAIEIALQPAGHYLLGRPGDGPARARRIALDPGNPSADVPGDIRDPEFELIVVVE